MASMHRGSNVHRVKNHGPLFKQILRRTPKKIVMDFKFITGISTLET